MKVRLISISEDPERLISYIARVSNPDNQDNPDYVKLIKFLIKNQHFSPFEHAYMTVEIKTSRAIAAQILRHRSFTFQEFSQRYSEATEFEPIEIRKQATKNRQSSLEVFNPAIHIGWYTKKDGTGEEMIQDADSMVQTAISTAHLAYQRLIEAGVAKEVARMILPLTTQTTLYMTGSIRSWIHYIDLRTKDDVQKEHREVALEIKKIFDMRLPTISAALNTLKKEAEDKAFLYKLLTEGYINIDDGKLTVKEGIYDKDTQNTESISE